MSKLILYILLVIFATSQSSTNQNPHKINQLVQFQAKTANLLVIQYFSLADIPSSTKSRQWYAFLIVKIPEQNFIDRIHLQMSTVSKQGEVFGQNTIKCQNLGEHISSCFIGSNQINIETQNLKITINSIKQLSGQISIQISQVKNLKINQKYVLQSSTSSFSRVARLDISSISSNFDFLMCQMTEENGKHQFQQYYFFYVSIQHTPPNLFRNAGGSSAMWGSNHQFGFTFKELQQVQVVTLTLQTVQQGTYGIKCSLLGEGEGVEQTMQLQANRAYNQIYKPKKNYHLKLPPNRSPQIYYSIILQPIYFTQLQLTFLKYNNKQISQSQAQSLAGQTNIIQRGGTIQLWVNSSITEVSFGVLIAGSYVFGISIDQYNTELIQLRKGKVWTEILQVNQTQYLYFIIPSKNGTGKVSFDIQYDTSDRSGQGIQLKFYTCSQKSPQNCKKAILSNDSLARQITISKLTKYPDKVKCSFSDLSLTAYQIQPSLYQSLIFIQASSPRVRLIYGIGWHIVKPLQQIYQNSIVRGYVQSQRVNIYYFNVLNAANIQFARIDFIFQGQGQIFASTELIDIENRYSGYRDKQIFFRFQNSITIPHLKNLSNYYIYVVSFSQGNYRLRLNFGHSVDDKVDHPITFITLAEQSKTEITLQPGEIAFLDIRVKNYTFLHLQNSILLKFCYIIGNKAPKSHQDVLDSPACSNIKTISTYTIIDYNQANRSYVAIQNEQNVPVFVKITTQTEKWGCFPVQMGQKHIFNLLTQTKTSCIIYQISHKAQVQIMTDLNTPQMHGVSHPIIRIGPQFKIQMMTNIKVISAQQIQEACEGQYSECFISISMEVVDSASTSDTYATVFASYTNRPLLLVDGIAHPTQIKRDQIKLFKYALSSPQSILVTLKSQTYQQFRIYAKLVTSNQKFVYPNASSYEIFANSPNTTNLTEIFISKANWIIGVPNLQISEQKILEQCGNSLKKQCYLLLSAISEEYLSGAFTIQVTQTVHYLRLGNVQSSYSNKGEVEYFSYFNYQDNNSLLFLVSSHASICHQLSLSLGNHQFKEIPQSNIENQVFVENAKKGWYTIIVTATNNCYYNIQASISRKKITQLSFGYGIQLQMKAGEKRYFLIRNQKHEKIKIIGAMNKNRLGQMILRGIPVVDKDMGDFLKFINGDVQIGKKNKLQYAWTDINHLAIRSSDIKYCQNCFICLELQAVKDFSGSLTMSADNLQNILMTTESFMYDILLKDQSFTWIFRYITQLSNFYINLQAGHIKIKVLIDGAIEFMNITRKFDKTNSSNNLIALQNIKADSLQYISIIVTALQSSDYSLSLSQKQHTDSNQLSYIQIGRPRQITISTISPYCIKGHTFNKKTQFILSLKDDHTAKGILKDPQQQAKIFESKLVVTTSVNQIQQPITVTRTKTLFLISFVETILPLNSTFTMCLELNETSSKFYRTSLILLGNLNYLPQNEPLHIKKKGNLTFMSDGKGVIEVDECQSRTTLTISNKYNGLTKIASNINQRRVQNNNIIFTEKGPVYIGVDSQDYVTVRWKNMHQSSKNGYGYQFYTPSTFRLHQDRTKDAISITIKPITQLQLNKTKLPEIVQAIYTVYIAKEESDLYKAMNCEKGEYMQWVRKITEKQQLNKQVLLNLNRMQDLALLFKKTQYVLIIVKASVNMKWKNGIVENYRYYYPYQQFIISPSERIQAIDNQSMNQRHNNSESQAAWIVIMIVVAVVVASVVICVVQFLRAKYRAPRLLNQQDLPSSSGGSSHKYGMELEDRMSKSQIQRTS